MLKINDSMTAKLDLMEPHVEQLTRMRDQHRSLGEILHWLWLQGVKIHGGHLTAFWQRRAEREANPPPPPQIAGSPPPLRKSRPSPNQASPPEAVSDTSHSSHPSHASADPPLRPPSPPKGEVGHRPDEVSPAPNNANPASERAAKLGRIMDKYLSDLKELVEKCAADPNPKLEDRQQIDRMLVIAIDYQRDQDQKAQRQQALDLKQAEYELKVKRLAFMEKQAEAKAKAQEEAAERDPPQDFDNTDLIADMRGEMFKEVYSPENMAAVHAAIAKAEAHLDPNHNPNIIHYG
jgi:hypothetical protein